MSDAIFSSPEGKARLEAWYGRFLARVPAPTASRTVPTAVGPTHVLAVGDPALPPVVCLHGARVSSAHLAPEMAGLLDRYHVLAPDIPGQSVRGPEVRPPVTDDSLPRWLLDVCDGLGLGELNLCGVSWGGFIVLRTAAAAPRRVRRLALVHPAGLVSGPLRVVVPKLVVPAFAFKTLGIEWGVRRFTQAQLSTWDDDWFAYFRDALRDFTSDSQIPPLAEPDELKGYTSPALVFAAGEDAYFPGRKVVARAKEVLPQAETELAETARHVPPLTDEHRRRFADRLAAFLA
jgi:pimeloyl-ACP methyl ester carboxylesterase